MAKSTLVIIIDGWPREILRDQLALGTLPTIELLGKRGAYHQDLATPIPSVSVASHTTILTATMPRAHRVPAHRWRDQDRYRNYIGKDIVYANRDISEEVPTLFESHEGRSYAVQSLISRGSDHTFRLPTLSSALALKTSQWLLTRKPSVLVACWLPRGDAIGHRLGPHSPLFAAEMRRVDEHLERLLTAFDAKYGLDNLRVALVPDHGQKPISDHADPAELIGSIPGMQRLDIQVNRRRASRDQCLVATSGDSAAGIYLPEHYAGPAGIALGKSILQAATVDAVAVSTVEGSSELHEFLWEGSAHTVEVIDGVVDRQEEGPEWIQSYLDSFVPGRSPNLLLLAGPDNDFSSRRRIGWGLGRHRGSHGGAQQTEMFVDAVTFGVDTVAKPSTIASLMMPFSVVRRSAEESQGLSI